MVKQDLTFWHQRWENNNIGFHQQKVNQDLKAYVRQHQQHLGQHVLLPLCGKSLDMVWLKDQGYRVTGIEISQQAIETFFKEQNLKYQTLEDGQYYQSENLYIIEKSFFELTQDKLLVDVDWIYDRAALIALDKNLRKQYAKQLHVLCPKAQHMLCVSMEKAKGDQTGPPFSVFEKEVRQLYKNSWSKVEVKRYEKTDRLDKTVYYFYKN